MAQAACENYVLMRGGPAHAIHKMRAYFAGSTSDKNAGIRGRHLVSLSQDSFSSNNLIRMQAVFLRQEAVSLIYFEVG